MVVWMVFMKILKVFLLKTREKLITDKENAYMSYDLATIYREVPIDFTLEDCKYNGYDFQKFKSILEELEFHSLLRKINFDMNSNDSFTEKRKKKRIKFYFLISLH